MKVVVSGGIGSGKSTAVRAAMRQLGWSCPAGFHTHWAGAGRGAPTLYLEPWGGPAVAIAQRVERSGAPGGLPYRLDLSLFEHAATASLQSAAAGCPVVVDELGCLELDAPRFAAALARLFSSRAPVLAVIQQRALESWMSRIGHSNRIRHFQLDAANRDTLPTTWAAAFAPRPVAGPSQAPPPSGRYAQS